jgi:hypothetical protein
MLDMREHVMRLSPLLIMAVLSAFTMTVQAKVVYVDIRAKGTEDGSTWSNAYVDLQTALEIAQETDEVRVAQGIYVPFIPIEGTTRFGARPDRTFEFGVSLDIRGGYAGTGHVDPNTRDVRLFRTVLSGDQRGNDQSGPHWFRDESSRKDNSWTVLRWIPDRGMQATVEGFYVSRANGVGTTEVAGVRIDQGGAIQAWLQQDCKLILRNCQFVNNYGDLGGAIRIQGRGYELSSANVENCHLYSNYAEMGACAYSSDVRISFRNCVFNTNEAVQGGAVSMTASLTEFINCTFNNNLAENGFAVDAELSLCSLQNCIVWGRADPIHIHNSTVEVQDCSIAGGFPGGGNIDADPLFVNALGEDGITGTEDDDLRLVPGSPCVNSGNLEGLSELLDIDAAGNARVIGEQVDMGAYEFLGLIYVDENAQGDPEPANPAVSDPNENGTEDHPFDSVSEAMEIAWDGYSVLVAPGKYVPLDANDIIRYLGRNIQLRCLFPEDLAYVRRTILGYTIEFDGTEGPECELAGFRIQGGGSFDGIFGNGTQATLRSCVIQGNNTCDGTVLSRFGGMMENCLITDNTSSFGCGERAAISEFSGTLQNCTIANNATGIHFSGATRIVNCILYHNQGAGLIIEDDSRLELSYSDIQDIERALQNPSLEILELLGVINEKPHFVHMGAWADGQLTEGDYHLKSQGLRWTDNEEQGSHWIRDLVTSPGIDTGDPSMTPAHELPAMPVSAQGLYGTNTRINMGFYGGTEQASFHHIFPIRRIAATASSSHDDMGPENTINGSGLNDMDQHSTLATDMWLSGAGDSSVWIRYAFDQVYILHDMWVWNSNQLIESFIGLGARHVTVETSIDSENWTALENLAQFARAPGATDYADNTVVSLGGALAKYVRIWIHDGWGMMPQYGLSEVQFFYTAQASYPILCLDDFEQYDDYCHRIFFAWQDGLGHSGGNEIDTCEVPAFNGNGTMSIIGNSEAPFAEQSIVHSGSQSMPYLYDNTYRPFHCEAGINEMTLAHNWTQGGANALSLYIQAGELDGGQAQTDPDPLYIVVSDASGQVVVVYHPDSNAVLSPDWQAWIIPLSRFSSIDLANIETMALGIGDREKQRSGNRGIFYVDDICLIKTALIAEDQ